MISPRLIAITDTTVAPLGLLEERIGALCRAAAPGSVLVQLRDPSLPTRLRLELGVRLRSVTRETGQLFAVNDRTDLAVLLEADGLHLGEASVTTEDARRVVGGIWISRALHDPELAAAAQADAVLLSPVVAPRKGRDALGVESLPLCRARLPPRTRLYALGGVGADSARRCLEHGADGVAVVAAVLAETSGQALLSALAISARR